jgi:hypothetical protein
LKEAGSLNRREKFCVILKMDPDTGAYQMLAEIATLVSIDLGARIIEIVVFDEGAEFRSPIVV